MKHVLVAGGQNLDSVRKSYGHDLSKLWAASEMDRLRSDAKRNARAAWEEAKASGRYLDSFSEDPEALLTAYVDEVCRLHTAESGYALRYVAARNETAPVPLLLLDSFEPCASQLAREYVNTHGSEP